MIKIEVFLQNLRDKMGSYSDDSRRRSYSRLSASCRNYGYNAGGNTYLRGSGSSVFREKATV